MYVIHNPTAGRRNTRKLWAVLDCLIAHGISVKIMETRYGGHASTLAREAVAAGARIIVAAGGDGTIAETVSGMVGSSARLGIIPLGTANVLAHEYGIPFHVKELAATLTSPHNTPLWPGVMRTQHQEKLFVQMVGAGFDAHVVHAINLRLKRAVGRNAYVIQTLTELPRYPFPDLTVSVDGSTYTAASAIISKGRLYGGPYTLDPTARPDKPGFSITLFRNGGIFSALRAGMALPQSRMSRLPGVISLKGSHISISQPNDVPIQADGDAAGYTAVTIQDAAQPVQLATPAKNPFIASNLFT
ncbi:sphingosine kinase [Neokomagataea thailandica NBRC 106555]|uniref:YegS/Rv2252/BmrU family lipid kinase n=2 Tax=Neokomagataea TaxID=1223423 RepID=A0A4Y6V7S6_9PROT|nr:MULTISPECIES: YegS/Rv2252/BmrU family lipid kinase [Neokomagataea]QDH24928.1 YegS/Rv2252/BmrU family lipid kinase [Neokomagataea tanensis]GBR51723.1 sphingosine kinase [Neokomagataea thailandica NBRC 106555]